MKKQFFALMVGGAICATSPVFAMDKEENTTPNSIPLNYNPSVEEKNVMTMRTLSDDEILRAKAQRIKWIFPDNNYNEYVLKTDTLYNGEDVLKGYGTKHRSIN